MNLPVLIASTLALSTFRVQNPNNGYEDYVRAASMLQGGDYGTLIGWSSSNYQFLVNRKREAAAGEWTNEEEAQLLQAKKLSDAGVLAIQRRLVAEYGRAIDIVKVGNEKPFFYPQEKVVALDGNFSALAGFKSVAKLFRADAYCRFADGDSRGATEDLLAGYTFALRIGGYSLMSELVSIACRAIILADFNENLAYLSDADAKKIITYVDSALARPDSFTQAVAHERDLSIERVTSIFDSSLPAPDSATEGHPNLLARLTPADRERAKVGIRRAMEENFSRLLGELEKGESTWAALKSSDYLPAPPGDVRSVEDLVENLSHTTMEVFDQAPISALKARAQLRLLGLHASIIDFRWKNNRLPQDLREAVPGKLLYDPMANEQFHYELLGSSYKLYSKGVASTGPIELKYRKQPEQPVDDGSIPPLP